MGQRGLGEAKSLWILGLRNSRGGGDTTGDAPAEALLVWAPGGKNRNGGAGKWGKKQFFGSGLEKDLQGKLDHGKRGVEGSRWDPGGIHWDKAPPGSWNLNSRGDVTP